jgi:hypothetical protein
MALVDVRAITIVLIAIDSSPVPRRFSGPPEIVMFASVKKQQCDGAKMFGSDCPQSAFASSAPSREPQASGPATRPGSEARPHCDGVEGRASTSTRTDPSGEKLLTHRRSPLFRAPTVAAAGVCAALASAGSMAHAVDAEVDSTLAAQAYEYSSPWGSPTVSRRRIMETLALGVYHLEGGEPKIGGPELSLQVRLRLDADPGVNQDERSYSATSNTFVPGLEVAPLDLMYAYLEGRRLFGGWVGFKLGRQYVTDALGWWAFDGGLVQLTTPAWFKVEAYGGFEERGGLLLSTPRFEQQGMYRGDRSGFDVGIYPQFQQAKLAPAFGAAIESSGVTWLHSRLDYRRVINQGSTYISEFPNAAGQYDLYTASRTSSEKIGYALDATLWSFAGAKGGLVYDLYNVFFSTWYANVDAYITQGLTVGADYEFFRPTFDNDSIFNFFTHNPMRTLTGRVSLDAGSHVDLSASGGMRSFTTDGDPNAANGGLRPTAAAPGNRDQVSDSDVLANLAARYRSHSLRLGFRGLMETGDRGHREGADISGEHEWLGGRWLGEARLSLYDWKDNLRPDRSATSFGYVLGVGFRPNRVARALVEFEHDMNSLVGQRFRLLALLNITVGK